MSHEDRALYFRRLGYRVLPDERYGVATIDSRGTQMKVDADAAGLDARRLDRIGEHLRGRYLDAGKIAGAQVAVLRHGQEQGWQELALPRAIARRLAD